MRTPAASAAFAMAVVAAFLPALPGCDHSAASPPPAMATPDPSASTTEDEVTAGLVEHHRYHHHGGVTLFIAMALDTLGVSAERRVAIGDIRATLNTRLDPARLAEQRLIAVLSEGLAAGNVETAKVDAALMGIRGAAAAAHDASADALNALHAALTASERGALADKVEAHWRLWQQANTDETSPVGRDFSDLAMVTEELSLTSDEVERIRAGLGERMTRMVPLAPEDVSTQVRAFGDAFREEAFDATQRAPSAVADAHLAGWGAGHLASFVEAAVLVLTPDQREKLARLLREHAQHGVDLAASR